MILVDAGPLVAIIDADDQHHEKCVATLQAVREPLGTVWPPLTEAMYLLADLPKAQDVLWEMIERGAIQLLPLQSGDVPRMRELVSKYADRHMDLADAALIRVAEREGAIALLVGDPGVGKSRLLHEFLQSLEVESVQVLEATCASYGRSMAYRPIAPLRPPTSWL